MTVLINFDLLRQSGIGENDNLEALDHLDLDLAVPFQFLNRNV